MNGDMQTVGLVRYAPGKREAVRIALPFRLDEPQVVMGGDAAYLLARSGSLLAVDTGAGGGKAELWRLETGREGVRARARGGRAPVLLRGGRAAAGRRHRAGGAGRETGRG
ncbi:Protein kinase OS=Streptomyces microflavus OX=1919 GN=HUT09_14700 PE=4 SV=1 [Streptomyces microflavus]